MLVPNRVQPAGGAAARGAAVWPALLGVAIVYGAAREAFLTAPLGELAAHAVSTITLCAGIIVLSWLSIRWVHPLSRRDAWKIGGCWLALTLAFEFLAGRFLFGSSWSRLLGDYNVLEGRIWVLVPLTTLVAPVVTARARNILS